MELVEGVTLTDFCDRQCLAPRERLGLFNTRRAGASGNGFQIPLAGCAHLKTDFRWRWHSSGGPPQALAASASAVANAALATRVGRIGATQPRGWQLPAGARPMAVLSVVIT
jgi:hypothetical protein